MPVLSCVVVVVRAGRKRLEVEITAPEGSFGSPIYVPTPEGFSSEPGCRLVRNGHTYGLDVLGVRGCH